MITEILEEYIANIFKTKPKSAKKPFEEKVDKKLEKEEITNDEKVEKDEKEKKLRKFEQSEEVKLER